MASIGNSEIKLSLAISEIKIGLSADNGGKFEVALMHYRRAIDWFLALSKDERENRSRTRLYEKKVNSLLDRCEVLKRWNHNSNEIYRPVQASGDLLSGLLELMEDNTQSVDSLSSAIDEAKKAVRDDNLGSYQSALQHYIKAIEFFKITAKQERNVKRSALYSSKVRAMMDRMAVIKAFSRFGPAMDGRTFERPKNLDLDALQGMPVPNGVSEKIPESGFALQMHGIKMGKLAVTADLEHDYEAAMRYYFQACNSMIQAVKQEKSQNSTKAKLLKSKVKEMIVRREAIRKHLEDLARKKREKEGGYFPGGSGFFESFYATLDENENEKEPAMTLNESKNPLKHVEGMVDHVFLNDVLEEKKEENGKDLEAKLEEMRQEKFDEMRKLRQEMEKKRLRDLAALKSRMWKERDKVDESLSKSMECPITMEIMRVPTILVETGQSYEREAILEWLEAHDTDPLSGVKLKSKQTIENFALKSLISQFQQNSQNS